MTDDNALAAVTATMKRMIKSRLPDTLGQLSVEVTSESPIAMSRLSETDRIHRLNLFLYEVRPSAAFRNQPPPGARKGSSGQVPLALELYYLVAPYPTDDQHEQVGQQLLGMGLLALHELSSVGAPTVRLEETDPPQDLLVELLRIVPVTLNGEELSRLWSALQAPLRPSAAFQVSPILIESRRAPRSAPPVLRRGPVDGGADIGARRAVFPEATKLELVPSAAGPARPRSEALPVFEAGERVRVVGSLLIEVGESSRVLLHAHDAPDGVDLAIVLDAAASNPDGLVFNLVAPARQPALAAGVYTVRVEVPRTVEANRPGVAESWSAPRTTNELPLFIAPRITGLTLETSAAGARLRVACVPPVRVGRRVLLIVGDRPLSMTSQTDAGSTLFFALPSVDDRPLPAGEYVVRLRVDGVDNLAANASDPFTFANKVTLP
jgi:hypothetical protein